MTTTLTPSQKLSAARIIIRDRLPYFRAALFGAQYREDPDINTYAMTENGVLLYNNAVIDRETVETCAASIMHELLHWLRDHSKRCRAKAANPRLWNIAADAEINDDIKAMGLTLPDGCVYASTFGCQDGNIAEVYYENIRANAKEVKQPKRGQGGKGQGKGQGQDPGEGGGEGEGDGSGDTPCAGAGWCGSVAGRPHPKEPKKGEGKGGGGKDGKDGDTAEGGGGEGRSEAEADRIRKEVAAAAVRHAATKGRGSVPGGFLAWAEAEIAPPKIDWRVKLAKVLKAAMAYRPGCVTTTWTGFGRKQAALGFGPGTPMTPKWRSPVPRVAVGVDTSGSMGSGEGTPLHQAACEVDGILRATNAAVQFVACDASIHSSKSVRTIKEALAEFKGGGGTDFRPVFEHFEDRRKTPEPPEVIVFITDGYGPAPDKAPKGMHTIWVLVGGHDTAPANWGDVIVVTDEGSVAGKNAGRRM